MVNATDISDKLWKCYLQTFGRDGDDRLRYTWAHSNLTWYINSGRASTPWIKAFCKANPKRLMKCAAKNAGTTDVCIKDVTKYLRHYCGLSREE